MKLCFAASLMAMVFTASAVTMTVDRTQQRFPWNGKIDVDVTLSGTESGVCYRPDVSLVDSGRTYQASTFDTEPILTGDGTHRIVWDFGADFPDTALTSMVVTVSVAPLADTEPIYLVFDLSAGKDATSYPHRYTMQAPELSSDVCRTTELWMRRIPAGQFTMGYINTEAYTQSGYWLPPHQVILSKPYYIGVFEMTQGQYYQLTGEWPSYFSNVTYRATRPVEQTSYQLVRGTLGWYDDPPSVQSSSKLYSWRTKFGFSRLDLPTEAQWEMAARGGTSMRTYDATMLTKMLGRNKDAYPIAAVTGDSAPDEGGTAKVGSYPANPWGLYDTMGNVYELTGDGNPVRPNTTDETVELSDYANDPYTDPRGPTQEMVDRRANTAKPISLTYDGAVASRGGSWDEVASHMLLHFRTQIARSIKSGTNAHTGFRLCITCE